MKTVVLISGYKRSGKDFSAEYLREQHGAVVSSFADPLKGVIENTFGICREDLEQYKNDAEPLYMDNGGRYEEISDMRTILQRFGTEGMKPFFGESVWADLMSEKILKENADLFVIPDFRFGIEYETLSHLSFKGYRIITLRIDDNNIVSTDLHASETEITDFPFWHRIDNTEKDDTIFEKLDKFIGAVNE